MPRYKKCVSGFCMSNMAWFLLACLLLVVLYLWIRVHHLGLGNSSSTENALQTQTTTTSILPPSMGLPTSVPIQDIRGDVGRCGAGGRTIGDPLTNPYVPPIRCDAGSLTTPSLAVPMVQTQAQIPINVPTQGYNTQYAQAGILTRNNGGDILPLMGRRVVTARDKWQYYTVAGGGAGGNLQTKLPVKVKGRSCSGEYGCEEIYNQDSVYVEGYQDEFIATIYESGLFSYIPY